MIDVFTDGSCPFNGKGSKTKVAGWACVFPSEPKRNISGKITENPTNNVAELMAIWMSLDTTRDIKDQKIRIYSDSTYSINCVSVWTEGWIAKGWKTAKGEPVKNRDLIAKIYDEVQMRDVDFIHVSAHKSDSTYETTNNNAADKMAVAAATGEAQGVVETMTRHPLVLVGEALQRGEKLTPAQIKVIQDTLNNVKE